MSSIVIVTAHYKEDLRWLCRSPYPVYLCDKVSADPIDPDVKAHFICEEPIPNLGCEASSYLHYIINHYNDLPAYMAFIHGHEHAWHQQHPLGIFGAITTAKITEYQFVSLNVKTHPGDGRVYDLDSEHINTPMRLLEQHWDTVFKPFIGTDLPRRFCHDSCAQFIVSRKAVLRHPIEAYKTWLAYVNTPSTPEVPNKEYAAVLEFVWHIIFGEPPICNDRDLDYLLARFNVRLI